MAGFLQKMLLGSGPSTKEHFTDPNRVMRDFGTFTEGTNDQLMQIIQQAMGGLGSFGPGFQGTAGTAAGKSILPFLGRLFQGALGTATPTIEQRPGSQGLLGSALGAFGGASGIGLAAKLFGGGGIQTGLGSSSSRMADLGIIPGQSGPPRF